MARIALQDPLMQVAHRLTRLDTEFVPEGAMKTLVRRQRIRAASGSVEGEHALGPQPFAERVRLAECLYFAAEFSVSTHDTERDASGEGGSDSDSEQAS